MTSLLLLAASALNAGTFSGTAQYSCEAAQFNRIRGTNNYQALYNDITCPGFDAGPNGIITSVTVYVTPDYSNGENPGPNQFNFTFTPPPTFVGNPYPVTFSVSGGATANVLERFLGTDTPNTQSYASFAVSVDFERIAGNAQTASSLGRIEYGYIVTTAETPEPATAIGAGAALIGLAFLRRRQRQK